MEKKGPPSRDVYKKKTGYVEVIVKRECDYSSLVNAMKKKFPKDLSSDKKCAIYRSNGARVLDEDVLMRGCHKPWGTI